MKHKNLYIHTNQYLYVLQWERLDSYIITRNMSHSNHHTEFTDFSHICVILSLTCYTVFTTSSNIYLVFLQSLWFSSRWVTKGVASHFINCSLLKWIKTIVCIKITHRNYRCPLLRVSTALALDPSSRTDTRQRPVDIGRHYILPVVNIVAIGISHWFSIFN